MKNFSELLATDRQLHVCIRLRVIADAGIPWVTVKVNGTLELDQALAGSALILTYIPCDQSWSIDITMRDKVYRQDLETAVIVDCVEIDGHNLVPEFTHLAHYHNDHGQPNATNYLGWNGTWGFRSDRAFYQWLHKNTGQGWLLEPISYEES